jgi:hypothetical protein
MRTALVGLLVLFPFAAWLYVRLQADDGSYTRPDFDRIQPGMTLLEAQAVVDPRAKWVSLNGPGPRSQYMVVWPGWDGLAMVNFNLAGRVSSKDYTPPAPTVRDKARSWWYANIGANPPF